MIMSGWFGNNLNGGYPQQTTYGLQPAIIL